jgi:pimeloyl-ACP methyl ester carboxylesterase
MVAPSERALLEAFFVFIYTARAHENGMVEGIIEDALEYPHPQSPEAFVAQLEAFLGHESLDRLPSVSAPTLVIAGDEDIASPARMSREVADLIPGARFVLLEGEAHQPFQESPEAFNALVDDFWRTHP